MRAMVLQRIQSVSDASVPLAAVDLPTPRPGPHDVLVKVAACGVCHTELDEIEGRLPPPRLPVVPGHQIVGRIEALGSAVAAHEVGTRVGIGWIHSSSGEPDENLSPLFRATGLHADGGYAEFVVVPERYAYPIPERFTDAEAAPLLCAGAIGYRALRLSGLRDGQTLGLMGFGGSAHLVLQLVRYRFPAAKIAVFAREAATQAFARDLGAHWAGGVGERAPWLLDAVIDTTPAWTPVLRALENLRPGGRLVINAIRKEAGDQGVLQQLSYHEHLWLEREIKSVANITGNDIREFLPLATAAGIRPTVSIYPLGEANRALRELKAGNVQGAKVLVP